MTLDTTSIGSLIFDFENKLRLYEDIFTLRCMDPRSKFEVVIRKIQRRFDEDTASNIIGDVKQLRDWLSFIGGDNTAHFLPECAGMMKKLEGSAEHEMEWLMTNARILADTQSERAVQLRKTIGFFKRSLTTGYLEELSKISFLPYMALVGVSDAAETTEAQIASEVLGAAAQRKQLIIYDGTNTNEYYNEIWKKYMGLSTQEKIKIANDWSRKRVANSEDDALLGHIRCSGNYDPPLPPSVP